MTELRSNNTPEQVELIKIHIGYFWDPERKDPFTDMAFLLGCPRTEAKLRVYEFLWTTRGSLGSDNWWRNAYFRDLWLKAQLSLATGWTDDEIEHMLDGYVQEMIKADNEKRPIKDQAALGTA